jgi:hypothetical protein
MSDDSGIVALLAAGPASAVGLYWYLFRHYRNTDKSHGFERETVVDAKPVTGTDRKVDEVKGTKKSSIDGNNVGAYRTRVRRIRGDDEQRE